MISAGWKTWIMMQKKICIFVKTAGNCRLYISGIPNRKQDMSVRKIFISVPPVKIAPIKASVSKETTARPQWKREIKFFLLQEPF